MYRQFDDDQDLGLDEDDDQLGGLGIGDDEEDLDDNSENDEYGMNSGDEEELDEEEGGF